MDETQRKAAYRTIVGLMGAMFLLGALFRVLYDRLHEPWLRGLPAIFGGLMFLLPIVVSLPRLRRAEYWQSRQVMVLRAATLGAVLLLGLAFIAYGIWLSWP